MIAQSKIEQLPLEHQRTFLRADLNVPIENGIIENDFRIKALVPTLDLLIQKKATIILGTHIDRPEGYNEAYSTKHLLPWFKERGYTIDWAPTIEDAQEKIKSLPSGAILLLENLRFDGREHAPDICFAQELSQLADYYINDAFGTLHHPDTSISLLPSLYPIEKKTIGLLIEKEIAAYNKLLDHEKFLLILGGGKSKDKLPYIELLLDRLQACIVLPAVAFPFLQDLNIPLGTTARDESLIAVAKKIRALAQEKRVPLILPEDFLIQIPLTPAPSAPVLPGAQIFLGPQPAETSSLMLQVTEEVPSEAMVVSIGPETINKCTEIIGKCDAVFINGLAGFLEEPDTVEPFKELLQAVAESNALSIVGGGESVAAVFLYQLEQSISFCSTGGGAALHYLAHRKLPALDYVLF